MKPKKNLKSFKRHSLSMQSSSGTHVQCRIRFCLKYFLSVLVHNTLTIYFYYYIFNCLQYKYIVVLLKLYWLFFFYRSGSEWCRGAGEGDHLLDGQAQFEAVQRVADANLSLDLCVGQRRHDGSALHVGATGCHIPGWHPHPQLVRAIKTFSVSTVNAGRGKGGRADQTVSGWKRNEIPPAMKPQ